MKNFFFHTIKEGKKLVFRRLKKLLLKTIILFLKPHKSFNSNYEVGVCSLLCHEHVDMFIVAVISFFYQTGIVLPIFIVSDGSLTSADVKKLKKYFSAKVISGDKMLDKYKNSTFFYFGEYRCSLKAGNCKMKYDAYLFNPFTRFVVLDADVLFFKYPKELVNFIKEGKKTLVLYGGRNKKVFDRFPHVMGYEYTLRKLLNKYSGHTLDESFNSGLLCVGSHRLFDKNRLNKIYKLFKEVGFVDHPMADETGLSLMWSSSVAKMLPAEKYVMVAFFEEYKMINKKNACAIHYMGTHGLKDKFLTDAIVLALKEKLFRRKRRNG